jgi:hypothetical protein
MVRWIAKHLKYLLKNSYVLSFGLEPSLSWIIYRVLNIDRRDVDAYLQRSLARFEVGDSDGAV